MHKGAREPEPTSFRAASLPHTRPHTQPPCKSHPGVRGTTLPSQQFHLNNITAASHRGKIPKLTIQKTSPQIRRDQSLFPISGFLTARG